MRRTKNTMGRKKERGVVITLVAVFMLFVIGAMAALSIDVVTLYTTRSEAQLAADSAALAGARVLANSGMTSDPNTTTDNLMANAQGLAQIVAIQVAQSNPVGGRDLVASNGEVIVGFNGSATNPCVTLAPGANPCITVQVQRTDLPTFFARIWGSTANTVKASATAEAYNPSNLAGTSTTQGPPVAPMCVKPWLLPNLSPTPAAGQIFDPTTGAIVDTTLLGWSTPTTGGPTAYKLRADCTTDCATQPANNPQIWRYYPGDPADFTPPNASSVLCPGCSGFNNTQLSIVGCVPTPIACNKPVHVYTANPDANLDVDAAIAVNNLTHTTTGPGGDSVDTTAPSPPFQFLAGDDNPLVQSGAVSAKTDIMVSDSLVTVPVIDTTTWPPPAYPQVQIIGFVQLFLSPTGQAVQNNHIHTQVINLVGCGTSGTSATGQPILGNGASPVAVRLISPP